MSECYHSSGDGGLRGNGQWSPWSTIAFLTAIGSGHASVTEVNINVYKFTCTRAPRILLMNKFITILREMRPNFAAQYHGKKTDWRTET